MQFTIYMACSNLGITLGASVFGFFDRIGGLPTMFTLVLALHGVGLLIMLLAKFPRSAAFEVRAAKVLAEAPGPAPRIK
jgi:PAT family beta-lactamase induction signal transducer AmpG